MGAFSSQFHRLWRPGWVSSRAAVLVVLSLLLALASPMNGRPPSTPDAVEKSYGPNPDTLPRRYDELPLSFEPNQGQTDARVEFLSRGDGYTLFLTRDEAVLALRSPAGHSEADETGASPTTGDGDGATASPAVLRMHLVNANPEPLLKGIDRLPGGGNYFIGADPRRWRTDVPSYARVKYERVYPGVDLVYHGSQGKLEFDFVVAPGADPQTIRLGFEGADQLSLDSHGNLVLSVEGGEVVQYAPVVYQEIDGARKVIPGEYTLNPVSPGQVTGAASYEVGFQISEYDRDKTLIIDPELGYSTYLGGTNSDSATAIAVDAFGNAYVTGRASSVAFPMEGPLQGELRGDTDVFVTKLSAGGDALLYSTYIGGSGDDGGSSIAVDGLGNAYVTGSTKSTDFPADSLFQRVFNLGGGDVFVVKLSAAGDKLDYSVYLGGKELDEATGIAVDAFGNAYVTGYTGSSRKFPTTDGALQPDFAGGNFDAFVTKLSGDGSALLFSTFLGGSSVDKVIEGVTRIFSGDDYAAGIAVDVGGNAYVTGRTESIDFPITAGAYQTSLVDTFCCPGDAFVTKLDSDGSALVYSSYLGGSGDENRLTGGRLASVGAIAIDAVGNAFVTGDTSSQDFPQLKQLQDGFGGGDADAFVTTLNITGDALLYSTYLGGSKLDAGNSIAVDAFGNAWITGDTLSRDFPTTEPIVGGLAGTTDAFVTKLKPIGKLLAYSALVGGASQGSRTGEDSGRGIAVDGNGNPYVAGHTDSLDFPITTGAFQTDLGRGDPDAFVAKVTLSADLSIVKTSVSQVKNPATMVKDLVYTVIVGNDGPDAATNVTLFDPLPPGVVFVSATPTQGSTSEVPQGSCTFQGFDPGAVLCNLGFLAKGGRARVVIVVTPFIEGTLQNTFHVVGSQIDPGVTNNMSTQKANVTLPQTPTPTPSPAPPSTVAPTATPAPSPTVAPVATPTPVPTLAPTATPVPGPTVAPLATPTAEPAPTLAPTATLTPAPTITPISTPLPVSTATPTPTSVPTAAADTPTPAPTAVPPADTPAAAAEPVSPAPAPPPPAPDESATPPSGGGCIAAAGGTVDVGWLILGLVGPGLALRRWRKWLGGSR